MNDPVLAPSFTQPQGLSADARIVGAISNLCDQFAVCGLKAPIAITVEPGERRRLEVAVADSGMLLLADTSCSTTKVWGVEIREDSP